MVVLIGSYLNVDVFGTIFFVFSSGFTEIDVNVTNANYLYTNICRYVHSFSSIR